jgi:hypothetical protein
VKAKLSFADACSKNVRRTRSSRLILLSLLFANGQKGIDHRRVKENKGKDQNRES